MLIYEQLTVHKLKQAFLAAKTLLPRSSFSIADKHLPVLWLVLVLFVPTTRIPISHLLQCVRPVNLTKQRRRKQAVQLFRTGERGEEEC